MAGNDMVDRAISDPPLAHHTADYIGQCLSYDPETGDFRWRERPVGHFLNQRIQRIWNAKCAGKIPGTTADGYRRIRIDGRWYSAQRLGWLLVTGRWPTKIVDHRNRNSLDNRFANFREATKEQNQRNSKVRNDNKSGFKGVSWRKDTGKWHARIRVRGKVHLLGNFRDKADAAAAYAAAAAKYHGEFSSAKALM